MILISGSHHSAWKRNLCRQYSTKVNRNTPAAKRMSEWRGLKTLQSY